MQPDDPADARPADAPPAGALLYEIEASLDPAVVAEYDAWLPAHARAVLDSPGFLGVELLHPADAPPGEPVRRISRYLVRDHAALEAYLESRAPALRADTAQRFGEHARFERRVLAPDSRIPAPGTERHCANCGAVLHGPWCSACGQLARESARSLGTVFHDAWHVFTHLDGTLWRTLRGLLLKPGFLTNEYFRDRRARYILPFRLYLVISLLFFGLASLTGSFQPEAPIQFDGEPVAAAAPAADAAPGTAPPAAAPTAAAADPTPGKVRLGAVSLESGEGFGSEQCREIVVSPIWLQDTVRRACERAVADQGRSLAGAFLANVPKMMFVFLPLMAAAMLLLYWRPRRYYVEHLVFYLHVHAAIFLALALLVLLGALADAWPALEPAVAPAGPAVFLYALWYVWRAMRVHYRDGRGLTLAKFATIAVVYLFSLGFTLAGTALISALTA